MGDDFIKAATGSHRYGFYGFRDVFTLFSTLELISICLASSSISGVGAPCEITGQRREMQQRANSA